MKSTEKYTHFKVHWLLDNLNTAVLYIDPELYLRYMNPAAEMLFAVSASQTQGLPINELHLCPEYIVKSQLMQALENRQPFTGRELKMRLDNGNQITVDCTLTPLAQEAGYGGVLIEMQKIDRHLRISRDEHIKAQHETMRDIVRGIAHEVKNPLGGLRGAAQLLERELPNPALGEYTQIIIAEADRLQKLVDSMLGPNKLPFLQPANLHHLVERVRHLVLAESGAELVILRDYDPSIPELTVDKDRIIQALLNILRNAANALEEIEDGRITLQTRILHNFTIGQHCHRLTAQIGILDNGPGIPKKIVDKIFYPMVTASKSGIGLGLSIAQSLIQQHGGLVECSSRPGETLFTVLLPLDKPNVAK